MCLLIFLPSFVQCTAQPVSLSETSHPLNRKIAKISLSESLCKRITVEEQFLLLDLFVELLNIKNKTHFEIPFNILQNSELRFTTPPPLPPMTPKCCISNHVSDTYVWNAKYDLHNCIYEYMIMHTACSQGFCKTLFEISYSYVWNLLYGSWWHAVNMYLMHGLINYIDSKAKCFHLKKLTCVGTLRHVCIVDWRFSQYYWYFRPGLWTVAPLTFSLVQLSPPFPCVNKYTCIHVHYTRTYCLKGGGGVWGSGPQTDNICRKF